MAESAKPGARYGLTLWGIGFQGTPIGLWCLRVRPFGAHLDPAFAPLRAKIAACGMPAAFLGGRGEPSNPQATTRIGLWCPCSALAPRHSFERGF